MKRNLPTWMLPKVAAATNPVLNSVSAKKICSSETEAIAKDPELTENAEIALKKAVSSPKRENSRRKSSSAECKVKRRRNLSEKDAISDGNAAQKGKKKKDTFKVRSLESTSKKSQIVGDPNCGGIDSNSVQGLDDDDVELTIEDLMTIAEEYAKEYETKKQKEASNSQGESVKQFSKPGEYGNFLDSCCDRKRPPSTEREGLYSSTSNKIDELIPNRTSQTGDPVQEMLEILLGPLPKPIEKEKNKSIIDSVEFTQEPPVKSQEQFSGEDKVPLTKRKYSLKDRVRLILD